MVCIEPWVQGFGFMALRTHSAACANLAYSLSNI